MMIRIYTLVSKNNLMQHFNEFLITNFWYRRNLKIVSPPCCSNKIWEFWDWTFLRRNTLKVDSSSYQYTARWSRDHQKLDSLFKLLTVACKKQIWDKAEVKKLDSTNFTIHSFSFFTFKMIYFGFDQNSQLSAFTLSALLSQ